MAVPLLDVSSVHKPIREEIRKAIDQVVDSGIFIMGPMVDRFEKHAASVFASKHAIAISSGTDALLAALMALDIGQGDEVILPPFTFFATAGAVWRVGAKPVFVDVDPVTYNLDPAKIQAAISPRTKAIMPVHLYGQCADMTAINAIAARNGLSVIEDAAQAHLATHNGLQAGSMGRIGCFSFYPTKNLAAFGDAGLCTTQDDDLARKLRVIRLHGQTSEYLHDLVGANFRLDAIQCAVLDVKLAHLHEYTAARRALAARYDKLLAGKGVSTPVVAAGNQHVYHQYTLRSPHRDALSAHLKSKSIAHKVYYPVPLHLQPCFSALGHKPGDFPQSEKAAAEVLSLPIFPGLSEAQQDEVVQAIASFKG